MTFLSAAITVFLVMDSIGNTPICMALLHDIPSPARRRAVLLREALIALAVLIVFLLAGPAILGALQLEMVALQVAGGVILFLIALRILFPTRQQIMGDDHLEGEPLIVPIAIPLLAGPSAITTVMLLSSYQALSIGQSLGALFAAWVATLVIMMLGEPIARLLGPRGMTAAQRLMGMILTVVAVQMLLNGIAMFMQHQTPG